MDPVWSLSLWNSPGSVQEDIDRSAPLPSGSDRRKFPEV